jgi:hypothetical protein
VNITIGDTKYNRILENRPGTVMHAYSSSYLGGRDRDIAFKVKISETLHLHKKLEVVVHACHPSFEEVIGRGSQSEASLE